MVIDKPSDPGSGEHKPSEAMPKEIKSGEKVPSDTSRGESASRESKSVTVNVRVSSSKSRFDGNDFVLVFKNSDGTYSSPRRIPREVAISVAKDFEANEDAAREYEISKLVAKFILAKAIRKGLVAKQSEDFDLSDIASDSIERSGVSHQTGSDKAATPPEQPKVFERQPKYFPTIDPYLDPDLSTETVEEIAFVLSGVDPEQLEEQRVAQRALNLRQLIQMSVARISPGILMQEDHWYVLSHLHHLDRNEFKSAWEDAQSQATGQANTDVVKVVTKLEKFKIDSTAKCLDDPSNKSFFVEVQEKSVELLSRNFRRIRRKIESVYEQPASAPKKGFLDKLFKRNAGAQTKDSPVQPEVAELVEEYLNQSIKIGRILRSDLLKQSR